MFYSPTTLRASYRLQYPSIYQPLSSFRYTVYTSPIKPKLLPTSTHDHHFIYQSYRPVYQYIAYITENTIDWYLSSSRTPQIQSASQHPCRYLPYKLLNRARVLPISSPETPRYVSKPIYAIPCRCSYAPVHSIPDVLPCVFQTIPSFTRPHQIPAAAPPRLLAQPGSPRRPSWTRYQLR